jgi:site-specific recombinase XerD
MNRLKLPKILQKIVATFTPEQLQRLVGTLDPRTPADLRGYLMLLALLDTDIGLSQLVGLNVKGIHFGQS